MSFWNERPATQAAVAAAAAAAATAQSGANASLKIASNLSDVASPSAARNAIAANQVFSETRFDDLRGATGQVRYMPWPLAVSGFGIVIIVVLDGPLATGDAVLTPLINGVAVDPATLTLVEAGSAAGSRFVLTYVGANTIPANAIVTLTCSGANTATVGAAVVMRCIF